MTSLEKTSPRTAHAAAAVTALAIGFIYALPLLMTWWSEGRLLYAAFDDEILYAARVVDAYRGGTLGNPFLPGHEEAARYMPEAAERSLGWLARVTGWGPFPILAASRVVMPVAIFLLVWRLAVNLGIPPLLACFGAALAPLASGSSQLLGGDPNIPVFLRYFRIVSPGLHLLPFLTAVLCFERLSSGRRREDAPPPWMIVAAGLALSLCFATPFYYWALAATAALWLALVADGPGRRAFGMALLLAALPAALMIGNIVAVSRDAAVQETLARFRLLLPSRGFEPDAVRYFLIGLLFLLPAILLYRRDRAARFLLPWLAAGTLFFVQNVITNRTVQSHHWVNALTPLWALTVVLVWSRFPRFSRAPLLAGLGILLAISAAAVQSIATTHLSNRDHNWPGAFDLDRRMPATLAWLRGNTPAASIVFASEPVMSALPLFTRNKVFWCYWGSQHAISTKEALARQAWTRASPLPHGPPPYPIDFVLAWRQPCSAPAGLPGEVVYRNDGEATCVLRASVAVRQASRP